MFLYLILWIPLADYLNLKAGKLDGFTDYDFDYDTVVNDLMINIENKK